MSQQNDQKWKYLILNINIEAAPTPPSPEEASRKLKGRLSPSFIQDQFPKEYKKSIKVNQCMSSFKKKELDRLGSQRWDLINISIIGSKLMFFSKSLTTKVLIRVDFSSLSFYLLSPCFSYAVGLPKGHVIK